MALTGNRKWQQKGERIVHLSCKRQLQPSENTQSKVFVYACMCANVCDYVCMWCDSRPRWGLAITPFSICCHTAHIVIPQFKGTLSGFKDLFKALILIGRSLFCHIKRGGGVEKKGGWFGWCVYGGGVMRWGWQRFLRVEDWQRICWAGRTEIWNIGHRMPAVIDMK